MRHTGRKTGRRLELGDKVLVEINNVSVVRRRIDFTLVATAKTSIDGEKRRVKKGGRSAPEPTPRAAPPARKKAAREVERATRGQVERGSTPRREGAGGKIRLGVSHRGAKKKR
jgi:hypothetical protein